MKAESSAYSAALWCNGAPFLVDRLFKNPSDSEGKYLRSDVFIWLVDHFYALFQQQLEVSPFTKQTGMCKSMYSTSYLWTWLF
jgi:hypothetical protein